MTKTDKNNLDVDNRSDTTRQASEGTIPWGASQWAGNNPFTEILSIINDKTRTTNNPNIQTGEPIFLPGFGGAKQIQQANKLMETINNFWKNLGKTKIRVQGAKTSGILTQPGTAPTTFNGQNIQYISSPNGQPVTHKFYTDQGSEYILTKDGFARRVKSPHTNTKGTDAGLHDWNQGKTYFLDDKGDFSGQFRLLKEKYPNVAVATGKDGKMYFLNTDTNKLILTEDLFPRAVNQGILQKGYYGIPYSYEPKLGYSLFEFGTNGTNGTINWYHPGSQVAFIEGLKQGGKMIRKGQNGFKYQEKQTDWFPKYKYTASTFLNMKNNLGIYFLNKHPNYPISKYKPTKGNPNNTYYSIPNLKYDVARNLSRAYLTNKPLKSFDEVYNDNKSGTSRETGAVNLGKYHVSTGQDEKGRYISYYDKYDWNLLEQMGLKGNSFEIYDRIYEDEWPEIYQKIFQNKQGGMLQLLKKGSGIHIKKKNRGKFTSYCGGKVTDECIRKAKASGNPTLVKRATFAANARKWKHQEGGVLQLLTFAQEGTKLNFFQKVGNFLNSEQGKNLVSGIMNGVQGIINTNKQQEQYNEYLNFLEENYKYEKSKNIAEKYKRALQNKSDLSDIVNANSAYIEANAQNDDTEFNQLKQYYQNLIKQNQQQGYYNTFVGLGNSVIGMLNSNKNASPSTTNKA